MHTAIKATSSAGIFDDTKKPGFTSLIDDRDAANQNAGKLATQNSQYTIRRMYNRQNKVNKTTCARI